MLIEYKTNSKNLNENRIDIAVHMFYIWDIKSRCMELEMRNNPTNQNRIVFLKSCPRCKGDVHASQDMYGDYQECLQCGFMADVPTSNAFKGLKLDSSTMDEVA